MSEIIVKDGLRLIRGVLEPEASRPDGHDAGPSEAEGASKSQKSNKTAQDGPPPNFLLSKSGLFWKDPEDDDKPLLFIAERFEVLANTRDDTGNDWGLLLQWKDPDGKSHEWAMPRSMLAGDGAEVRRTLLHGGLNIAPSVKARNHLTSFLTGIKWRRARARFQLPAGMVRLSFFPMPRLGKKRTSGSSCRHPAHPIIRIM